MIGSEESIARSGQFTVAFSCKSRADPETNHLPLRYARVLLPSEAGQALEKDKPPPPRVARVLLPEASSGQALEKRRRILASGILLAITLKTWELSISPPYKGGVLPVYREGGG